MKIYNSLLLFLLLSFSIILPSEFTVAQISQGGTPVSFSLKNIPDFNQVIELEKIDILQIKNEDALSDSKGEAYRYGKVIPLKTSIDKAGTWTELPNGDKIWRLTITSEDALALSVYYDRFYIPTGAKLFLYNADKTHIIGAFTDSNNPKQEEFSTIEIKGDATTLEYYEPKDCSGKPIIDIAKVVYIYRGVDYMYPELKTLKASGGCQVDVMCPEGDAWANQRKGVARTSIVIGAGSYLCSGSLVNNTGNDCAPYFLSAYHCIENATADEFNGMQFYFNYKANVCDGPFTGTGLHSTTGATKVASAINNIGSKSDMVLMELNNLPSNTAATWGVYFNGWSRSTTASTSGVGIHHPNGDIMKISTYTATLTTFTSTHWYVLWAATESGFGVTEGGSSGSPIFNPEGQIVGTLTGGYSACSADSVGAGTGPDKKDWYGKFSFHWQSNGSTDASRLKPWLDPAVTNVTTLNGTFAPCGDLTAEFTSDITTVLVGDTVNFTNLSIFQTSQSWSFEGGIPLTSSVLNPSVQYNTLGDFDVSLVVADGSSTDTIVKVGYIHVVEVNCNDTLSNIGITESIGAAVMDGYWGYLGGHNQFSINEYAEKFTGVATNLVDGIFVMPSHAYNMSGSGHVTFNVYQGGALPGTVLGSQDVLIASLIAGSTNYIAFDTPVNISASTDFFVGYEIFYGNPVDTFNVYVADDRGVGNLSTAYMNFGGWTSFQLTAQLRTSLALMPLICQTAVEIDETIGLDDVNLYPNPSSGIVILSFGKRVDDEMEIHVFDLFGKQIQNLMIDQVGLNIVELNLSHIANGIYIIHVHSEVGEIIVKKVSICR